MSLYRLMHMGRYYIYMDGWMEELHTCKYGEIDGSVCMHLHTNIHTVSYIYAIIYTYIHGHIHACRHAYIKHTYICRYAYKI